MKKQIFLCSFILVVSFLAQAQNLTDTLKDMELPVDEEGDCPFNRKEMTKMDYEKIQPEWQCYFAKRTLKRDSKECFISPTFLKDAPILEKSLSIKGTIRYIGIAPLPYKYKLEKLENGGARAVVRIHYHNFQDFSSAEQSEFRERWKMAQDYWNSYSPVPEKWSIKVEIVDQKEQSDFHPTLLRKDTRGPYFAFHSYDSKLWPYMVLAHELGHMLGLDDEYDQIRGTLSAKYLCNPKSLMCASYYGEIFQHHFYSIFRRGYCSL